MTARDDMDRLLDVLVTASQQFLGDQGGFYPHGAVLASSGELELIGGWTGEEHPEPTELIDLIEEALRERARSDDIRATGLAIDVRIVPPGAEERSDAISVALEHSRDDPVMVFLPYKAADGTIQYGEVFAAPGERRIFVQT
jgi:hypothetical protein